MDHYFFDPATIDLANPPSDVGVVRIPGLAKPVVATIHLARELSDLVRKNRDGDARRLVEWFDGMKYQGVSRAE